MAREYLGSSVGKKKNLGSENILLGSRGCVTQPSRYFMKGGGGGGEGGLSKQRALLNAKEGLV